MGFFRQGYWSRFPFPPPGTIPDPGIKPEPTTPVSPALQANFLLRPTPVYLGFPCDSAGKESAFNKGDLGSIPRLGRSPGEGKGHPLQYLDLENSMDSIVYGITKSWTQLSDFHFSSLLQSHQRSPNHIYLLFKVLMP